MPDGHLIYRSSLVNRIVRIAVRACPDGRTAAEALTTAFRKQDDEALVLWEPSRR